MLSDWPAIFDPRARFSGIANGQQPQQPHHRKKGLNLYNPPDSRDRQAQVQKRLAFHSALDHQLQEKHQMQPRQQQRQPNNLYDYRSEPSGTSLAMGGGQQHGGYGRRNVFNDPPQQRGYNQQGNFQQQQQQQSASHGVYDHRKESSGTSLDMGGARPQRVQQPASDPGYHQGRRVRGDVLPYQPHSVQVNAAQLGWRVPQPQGDRAPDRQSVAEFSVPRMPRKPTTVPPPRLLPFAAMHQERSAIILQNLTELHRELQMERRGPVPLQLYSEPTRERRLTF